MMINSRKLSDLDPDVRVKAEALLSNCRAAGIDLLITSTYRSFASQAALYAQGRTAPGSKVTNAQAGHSWHNWRRAFDMVPMLHGKPVWDIVEPVWARVGLMAQEVGLEWGGTWRKFPDYPHCQFLDGRTIDGMLANYPKGLPDGAI